MLPWRTITIQGYLHQSEDAIVVGWETALRISLAITATEAKVWSPHHQISDRREKPLDSAGDLHVVPRCVYCSGSDGRFLAFQSLHRVHKIRNMGSGCCSE
jgi:hypothetical protein